MEGTSKQTGTLKRQGAHNNWDTASENMRLDNSKKGFQTSIQMSRKCKIEFEDENFVFIRKSYFVWTSLLDDSSQIIVLGCLKVTFHIQIEKQIHW